VLCGLIDAGFTEFRRVGSLKKIAKVLLPWVATTSGQKGRGGDGEIENALRELRAMLSEPLQPKERAAVQQTLNELISDTGAGGKSSGRMAQLQQQAVIGTTCQSANKSVLDALCGDGRPAIVLMDECSQMLEPMSLVALARFRAARLVAVSRAFPSCTRSILTEIYLCHACSHHEIVDGNARPGGRPAAAATHARRRRRRRRRRGGGGPGRGAGHRAHALHSAGGRGGAVHHSAHAVPLPPQDRTHRQRAVLRRAAAGRPRLAGPSNTHLIEAPCSPFTSGCQRC
jgi:hypothetical protein